MFKLFARENTGRGGYYIEREGKIKLIRQRGEKIKSSLLYELE